MSNVDTIKSKNYLLCVPTESYTLVLIVLKGNVVKQAVGNIFYYMPLNWEKPVVFVKFPKLHVLFEVHRS